MRSAFRVKISALGEPPMPQYDVYANPSRSAADGIPYVVVIQSDLLDALADPYAKALATALEDLITARVDKMSRKVSGAA